MLGINWINEYLVIGIKHGIVSVRALQKKIWHVAMSVVCREGISLLWVVCLWIPGLPSVSPWVFKLSDLD
jgi:hypothetical protein